MRKRILLSLALLLVFALPVLQSSPSRGLSSSAYTALADATPDPSGGHTSGSGMKVAPPHNASNRYREGQSRGTLPGLIGIISALLSAIRLL